MKLKLLTTTDLRSKKSVDIDQYVTDLKRQRIELMHLIATNKEKQTHQIGEIKRAIAQAKTLQAQALRGEE